LTDDSFGPASGRRRARGRHGGHVRGVCRLSSGWEPVLLVVFEAWSIKEDSPSLWECQSTVGRVGLLFTNTAAVWPSRGDVVEFDLREVLGRS